MADPTWTFEVFLSEGGDTAIVECHADPPQQYAFNLRQGDRVLRRNLLTSGEYGFARIKVHKSKLNLDRENELNAELIEQAEEPEEEKEDETPEPAASDTKKTEKKQGDKDTPSRKAFSPKKKQQQAAQPMEPKLCVVSGRPKRLEDGRFRVQFSAFIKEGGKSGFRFIWLCLP